MTYTEIDKICKLVVTYYYSRRVFSSSSYRDDLLQECRIEAYRVLEQYDPTYNASEKTFLIRCLKNKLSNIARKNFTYLKYHCKHNYTNNVDHSILSNVGDKVILDQVFDNSTYHDKLRQLTELLLEGYTQTEVANKWGVSRQRISQLVESIKVVLKKKGLAND